MTTGVNETYLFMSQPRAVQTRKKFREPTEVEEELGNTANLMFDPRVMRGVTCGQPVPLNAMDMNMNNAVRNPKRASKRQMVRQGKIRPKPPSVKDIHENIKVEKKRVEVPLHLYLLEQEDPVSIQDESTQTDAFLEEPPSPKFIPRKTGVDTGAQVDPDEVFDYDRDVAPILEVVISKVMEQGLMEVRQEEELKSIARSKAFLEDKSRQRQAIAKSLEQKERGATKTKEQVMAEARVRADKEKDVHKKLASDVFANRWLVNLQQNAFADLDEHSYFRDPTDLAVAQFMPWLQSYSTDKIEELQEAQGWLDGMLGKTFEKGQDEVKAAHEERARQQAEREEEERQQLAREAEEARKKRVIEIYIHTDVVPNSPVGPIKLKASSTVEQVEEEIISWLQENADDPPAEDKLRFLWNGQTLDKSNILYDLGVETLSTITMELID